MLPTVPRRRGLEGALLASLALAGLAGWRDARLPARTPRPSAALCPAATWSLGRLAEQTVVVPVDESDVALAAPEVAAGAGGLILFGSSAPSSLGGELRSLVARAPGGIAPFVMADEEGGAVQRLANLVGSVPSARQMGATMSPLAIEQLAQRLGRRLRAAGVTMDLAPVLDVDGGAGPNALDADGTRSFSSVEPVAAADGLAFAAGLERAGVVPVAKHFPGLGGTRGNTDLQSAATPPLGELERVGLRPFVAAIAAGIPAVMVSNATVPGLTTVPASISHAAIGGLLRKQLGFRGLVLTDSLSARSLSGIGRSVPSAAVAAVASGADLVLYNSDASELGAVTASVVAAELAAVHDGRLASSTLRAAAGAVLAAKHVAGCGR